MFIFITTFTLWALLLFGWKMLDQHFSPGNVTLLLHVLLSPISAGIMILWMLCLLLTPIVILIVHRRAYFNARHSGNRGGVRFILSLDVPLFIAGLLLIVYGWNTGWLAPLLLGAILAVGLLLHGLEQGLNAFIP